MPVTIIVDGPNFINALHREGKDIDYILNTLSFSTLHGLIQNRLNRSGLVGHPFLHTYFICSDKKQIGPFKNEDRAKIIDKIKKELGVSVVEIKQSETSGGPEKEVDMQVFIHMLEMGPLSLNPSEWKHICLISADKDYVPAVKILSKLGTHTVVVGFNTDKTKFPIELINESYLFIELSDLLKEMEKIPHTLGTKMK